MQKTSRSLERGFVLVAGGAGVDEAPSIPRQSGPPEATLYNLLSPLDPRVAGEFGAMSPLENLGPEVRWNIQAFWRTGTGSGLVLDGSSDPFLHLPGKCGDET